MIKTLTPSELKNGWKNNFIYQMVDPTKITNFNRNEWELEQYLLFCISAGKTASVITVALQRFINAGLANIHSAKVPDIGNNYSPFGIIRNLEELGLLDKILKDSRLGQYNKLKHVFVQLAYSHIDLKTCDTNLLEQFKGIGPKTSRFFILHSRKTDDIACLDTHILAFMRDVLKIQVPKTHPTGKKYLELEKKWLNYAKTQNKTTAELDLDIWNMRSKRSGNKELVSK